VYYLCGLCRQLGLPDAILIGETGAVIQGGSALPPRFHIKNNIRAEALSQMARVREALAPYEARLWYQPNEVALTPFPRDSEMFEVLDEITCRMEPSLTALDIYRQVDCIDFIPKGTSKMSGLQALAAELGASPRDFLVIGDGENDVPMFQYADFSICIHHPGCQVSHLASKEFATLNEALEFVKAGRAD
jgi:hydroxymethylpyrimidine pyrophosphatase-like HAD family hydrolase